jgi:hypothetical protein
MGVGIIGCVALISCCVFASLLRLKSCPEFYSCFYFYESADGVRSLIYQHVHQESNFAL